MHLEKHVWAFWSLCFFFHLHMFGLASTVHDISWVISSTVQIIFNLNQESCEQACSLIEIHVSKSHHVIEQSYVTVAIKEKQWEKSSCKQQPRGSQCGIHTWCFHSGQPHNWLNLKVVSALLPPVQMGCCCIFPAVFFPVQILLHCWLNTFILLTTSSNERQFLLKLSSFNLNGGGCFFLFQLWRFFGNLACFHVWT